MAETNIHHDVAFLTLSKIAVCCMQMRGEHLPDRDHLDWGAVAVVCQCEEGVVNNLLP